MQGYKKKEWPNINAFQRVKVSETLSVVNPPTKDLELVREGIAFPNMRPKVRKKEGERKKVIVRSKVQMPRQPGQA